MAVAVKTAEDRGPRGPLNRLAVASLLGVVYVLGSLGWSSPACPACGGRRPIMAGRRHFGLNRLLGRLIVAGLARRASACRASLGCSGSQPPGSARGHLGRLGVACGAGLLFADLARASSITRSACSSTPRGMPPDGGGQPVLLVLLGCRRPALTRRLGWCRGWRTGLVQRHVVQEGKRGCASAAARWSPSWSSAG